MSVALWRFVSRDALGNIEFEKLFAGNESEARTYYQEAETRARRDGGHVELLCGTKLVSSYRGSADNE